MSNDQTFTDEIWKSIKGYEGVYDISSLGRVRSFYGTTPPRILKPGIGGQYPYVILCRYNKQINFMVHRLVTIAFIENPENKPEVNHKDGNKLNNKSSNLEWVTKSENARHAMRMGLRSYVGEKNGKSKLTDITVRNIHRLIARGMTQREIAELYDVSTVTISDVYRGRTWSHVPNPAF